MKHCERLCYSPLYNDDSNYNDLDEMFSEETIEQAGRLVKVSKIVKVDRVKEKDGLNVSDFSIDSLLATNTKMPDKVVTMPYPSSSNVEQFKNYVNILEEMEITPKIKENVINNTNEEIKTE